MFSATKFLIAGAIVALFGGFLLAGVLTQQPTDEPLPPAAASASASPEADATDQAVRSDLLPGVDLVTEEVAPGVYRVLNDGVRELVRFTNRNNSRFRGMFNGNIAAGLDGSVWWFGLDGFHRLGDQTVHPWPDAISTSFLPGMSDIEVGHDGTVWLTTWFGDRTRDIRPQISSYDGQAWSKRWRGAGEGAALDVEVQPDGTVWMAWYTDDGDESEAGLVRAARLGDDDWEILPGVIEAAHWPPLGGDLIASGTGESGIRFLSNSTGPLRRHDGEGWVVEPTPEAGGVVAAAVGPDGTLWVRLDPTCRPDAEGCDGASDVLARRDGQGWEVYDSSDGIPRMDDVGGGSTRIFEVAPDGSVWFNPTEEGVCGVARFDGEVVTHYLRDACSVAALDIAPDGTVWLQAADHLSEPPRPIHTYAITPEAAASE